MAGWWLTAAILGLRSPSGLPYEPALDLSGYPDDMGHSKTEALERLYDLDQQAEKLRRKIVRAVATARRRGATWDDVALYLQITRQSAWERFADRES